MTRSTPPAAPVADPPARDDPRGGDRAAAETDWQPVAVPVPDFPGCRPIRLTRTDVEDHDGRFEYWDAALETAWVCEPTSPWHEAPCGRLAGLSERIAAVRGSAILCLGNMDLEVSDAEGRPQRIMQADQVVYLHPTPDRLPGPRSLVVGEHTFPDVVLEVDHSTDVRRSKLGLYESWGFPELWVEVPERRAASRPRSRRPGLTIHVLEAGRYRTAASSRALPGWTAAEIHTALNEVSPSAATTAVLERVGGALGAREGTGPDDDSLLRSQRRTSHAAGRAAGRAEGHAAGRAEGHAAGRAEGHAAGRAEGHAAGRAEGHAAGRAELIETVLRSRGIRLSAALAGSSALADVAPDALLAAAARCVDEDDFWRRLRRELSP